MACSLSSRITFNYGVSDRRNGSLSVAIAQWGTNEDRCRSGAHVEDKCAAVATAVSVITCPREEQNHTSYQNALVVCN